MQRLFSNVTFRSSTLKNLKSSSRTVSRQNPTSIIYSNQHRLFSQKAQSSSKSLKWIFRGIGLIILGGGIWATNRVQTRLKMLNDALEEGQAYRESEILNHLENMGIQDFSSMEIMTNSKYKDILQSAEKEIFILLTEGLMSEVSDYRFEESTLSELTAKAEQSVNVKILMLDPKLHDEEIKIRSNAEKTIEAITRFNLENPEKQIELRFLNKEESFGITLIDGDIQNCGAQLNDSTKLFYHPKLETFLRNNTQNEAHETIFQALLKDLKLHQCPETYVFSPAPGGKLWIYAS